MREGAPERGLFGMREENVARRIEYEMRQRDWSQERLAREMSDAGYPIHQSAISKIINARAGKRRTIGVDEAIGFARVFGSSLESLAAPIATAKSVAVRQAIEDISRLAQQRVKLGAEISQRWERLRELLGEPEVAEIVVRELIEAGHSRESAVFTLMGWVGGAIAKDGTINDLDSDATADLGSELARRIRILEPVRNLINQAPGEVDPAAIETFLSEHKDELHVLSHPTPGQLVQYLEMLAAGEELGPARIANANLWLDVAMTGAGERLDGADSGDKTVSDADETP